MLPGIGSNVPHWFNRPLTHIAPVSLSDGATFERKLDWVYRYIADWIIPQLDYKLDEWFKDISSTKGSWQKLFDDFMADVVAQLEGLNDQAVANLVRSSLSELRKALDENFASKEIQQIVQDGRLSDTSLTEKFASKAIQTVVDSGRLSKSELDKSYTQVNSLVRDIRDWGAKSSATVSYHAEISNALRGGNCVVYFPAGKWLIQGTLRLQKNTTVILHPDAVLLNDNPETEYIFINGELGNRNYARAYSGDGNITITGGTIDNSPKASKSVYVSAAAFGHAENILIENVTFKNNYKSHFVEFNAIRNGTITNCRFINLNPDDATNREAINIDYAFEIGFPAFGAYDNTPCENITISHNEFVDVNDGVGSHSWAESLSREVQHKDIKVLNNTFRNLSGTGVHTNNWIESEISGNTMKNVAYRGVYLQRAFRCMVVNNKIIDSGMIAPGVETVIFLGSGSSDNFLESNTIFNLSPLKYHSPYRINDGAGNIVNTSGAVVGESGLTVGNIPDNNTVDNSTRYRIENNSVAKIPVTAHSRQGMVSVSCQSNSSNSIRGIYWLRCDANPAIATVGQVAAASTATATGVLNGSTGAAGFNTISAASDGNIYIENRSGDPKLYDVRFITL